MGLHNAAVSEVSIHADPVSKRVSVTSPFSSDFVGKAKMIGGKWDGTSRRWTFAFEHAAAVSALCLEVFGVTQGAPKPTREALERSLASHLSAIAEIQVLLEAMDEAEAPADAGDQ